MRRPLELVPRGLLGRRPPCPPPVFAALPALDAGALCRQIVESSLDCIKLLDREGRLLWMNEPGARLMEIEEALPLGTAWLDFWGGTPREAARAALDTALAGGVGRFTGPCPTFTGRMKWWNVVVAPAGSSGRVVSISRDVTDLAAALDDQNALAAAERTARDEADRANAAKDELLATVSHELRTPINAILGWSVLLQHRTGDPQAAAIGRQIEEIAGHELKLVADVIDEHWLARGAPAICQEPVAVFDVVRDVVAAMAPLTDAKRQTVVSDVAPSSPRVMGEPHRLRQVFTNLLSNAMKFTPAGGTIAVTGAVADGAVTIAVTDSGVGIPQPFLGKVFERFTQEDTPDVRRHGGLGLGLAIARNLVSLHGGSIRAESGGRGQGARFVVSLPEAVTVAVAAGPAVAPPASTPRLDGVTVALQMADGTAAGAVGAVLRQLGASVILPGDEAPGPGLIGVDIVVAEASDAVDSPLAEPSAWRALSVRSIALTAPGVAARARAHAAGFDRVASKPVAPRALAAEIARLLS